MLMFCHVCFTSLKHSTLSLPILIHCNLLVLLTLGIFLWWFWFFHMSPRRFASTCFPGFRYQMYTKVSNSYLSNFHLLNSILSDFPGDPVVKNLPYNAGDLGSILGRETKIPHAVGQLSPHATTTELVRLNERARMPQTSEPTHSGACVPQLERENSLATTREKPVSHI